MQGGQALRAAEVVPEAAAGPGWALEPGREPEPRRALERGWALEPGRVRAEVLRGLEARPAG